VPVAAIVVGLAWSSAVAAEARAAGTPARGIALSAPAGPTVSRGAWASVRVRVSNGTRRRATGLLLKVSAPKGVSVRVEGAKDRALKRALRPIAARGRRIVVVRLRAGATALATTRTGLTVSQDGHVRARGSVRLRVKEDPPALPPTPPPSTPVPTASPPAANPPAANPLVGRYFWRTYLITLDLPLFYETYYFANAGYAYRGEPRGGLPSCPGPTTVQQGDGCVPYTYDAASGTVTVDSKSGMLTAAHVLRLGKVGFSEALVPAPGTTFDTSVTASSGIGFCPAACTYVASNVRLLADGQFARSGGAVSTFTTGSVSTLPPDQRGSYAILDGGRIQFTYADGHALVQTIGVVYRDDAEPDPTDGLLLDGTYYSG
jgi:hypothetical protein